MGPISSYERVMSQGKSEKLARLWTEHQPTVGAYVLALIPNFHQSEDVMQQVAVVLVREFDKYDPSRPFLPWALGIARNVVLKSRRDVARRPGHSFSDELLNQIEIAFYEDEDAWCAARQFLKVCLSLLPPRSVEILRSTYQEELKPNEIAKRIGMTSGAVRVKLHRAHMALQKCIRRHRQLADE